MSVSSSDLPNSTAKPPSNNVPSALPERSAVTSSASGDTLLEALKLTLQRLGLDANGFPPTSISLTDTDSLGGSSGTADSQARGQANRSAGQQFLVALYQALVLQNAIGGPAQQEGDAAPTDAVTSAYADLGSSIQELAKTVRSTSSANSSSPSDTWDWQLDDVHQSTPTSDPGSADSSAIAGAVSTLDNALQSYVTPASDTGEVSLADVLDGLGAETKGLSWNPLGLLVDVKI
ncbi:hypothetical protein M0D69_30545 [Caballeronia sp. SEWSISQ10-4 2]|uniref:hypothetical protein n=1 Tax=Caballeronia sp. SEWSISQ10-4 2 TaxID=2937438 RepID=UPI00264C82F8|nr:hypothetical protein [Caballeronia sp. SEWSISQ10-4 2]MDN7182279.1 hypothetical protein [Caballeronia sp. SEWSISQ10-4 2]